MFVLNKFISVFILTVFPHFMSVSGHSTLQLKQVNVVSLQKKICSCKLLLITQRQKNVRVQTSDHVYYRFESLKPNSKYILSITSGFVI